MSGVKWIAAATRRSSSQRQMSTIAVDLAWWHPRSSPESPQVTAAVAQSPIPEHLIDDVGSSITMATVSALSLHLELGSYKDRWTKRGGVNWAFFKI